MKATIGTLLIILALPIIGIYGYVLVFGQVLKPDSTYRETTYVLGKEVETRTFNTVSAEKARERTIKLFSVGVTMLVGGLALTFWPSGRKNSESDDDAA